VERGKRYEVVSDTTAKLFALPVRCYGPNLTPILGAWTDPYFQTMIGLGFSGSCFEALTVIAHVGRALSALVAPEGDTPLPTKEGLVQLISELCGRYFHAHSGFAKPYLTFLVFGFEEGRPWIGTITCDKHNGPKSSVEWAGDDTLVTVGQDDKFRAHAEDWRNRILKHRAGVEKKAPQDTEDGVFEKELAAAKAGIAEQKWTEAHMLQQIDTLSVELIGGVLQRLELAEENGVVYAAFTHDDRDYLGDTSVSVANGALLGPIPIVQKMGLDSLRQRR